MKDNIKTFVILVFKHSSSQVARLKGSTLKTNPSPPPKKKKKLKTKFHTLQNSR
jgi:hypothetical protein